MNKTNLLLKIKRANEAEIQVKAASRITIDGRGALIVHDPDTRVCERIKLSELAALRLQPLKSASGLVKHNQAA